MLRDPEKRKKLAKLLLKYYYRTDEHFFSMDYSYKKYEQTNNKMSRQIETDIKNGKLSEKEGTILLAVMGKEFGKFLSYLVKNKILTPDKAASMLNGYISTVGKLFGKDVGDLVKGAILRTLIQLGMEEVTGKMLDLSLSRFFNKDGSIKKISEQDAKEILEEFVYIFPREREVLIPLNTPMRWS